ncbi:MAG: Gfo/Idh/MocA family oxidoreductase [Thermoanaerobacteraceae bacterium]|nr:Gfo/Idh/MocA family oxidoreductase [Thermoanaerobacteraceae bacterium]
MKDCNVAIIGLGGFAKIISAAIRESKKVQLIAGCDINPEKLEKFKEETGIEKVYDSVEKLLPDPDINLVIIATLPAQHYDIGILALKSGKHVFFEKPGALTPHHITKLIELAESKNLKTSIDFVMRRNPLYFILKTICDLKILGLPERAALENYAHDDSLPPEHWFWDYEKSGGIWVEHGVHFFDLANWLMGMPSRAHGEKIPRETLGLIDRVLGTAYHNNGTVISYYHGFTKPEAFEKTHFSLVLERAYANVEGWIPIKLSVDAMVTPEIQKFMMSDLLLKARSYLPGIDISLGTKLLNNWNDEKTFLGCGKEYRATARIKFTYQLTKDRWEVYRACIRQGIEDLAAAVKGEKNLPEVTLYDAKKALDVAFMMEGQ